MNYLTLMWRFIPFAVTQFRLKRCQQRAAALTYMTLFGIVPMMTVTYAMFSLIPSMQGMGEELQTFLLGYIVPSSELQVHGYLQEFSSQARSLTWVGIAMLVATAYLMLKSIEQAFNDVWGVLEARKGLSNFLLYWAVLSLGPLLLGLGFGVSTYLLSLKLMVSEYDSLGLMPVLLSYVPWLLTAAAFTLLFAAVPNCKVPLKHALFGGVVSAILFEVLKYLFALLVAHSDFRMIYGAFAIVPLFLLWVNLLWMIVLAGAVMVRNLSTYKTMVIGETYPDLIAALLALWRFHECLRTGVAANDTQLLKVGIEADQWQRVRDQLLRHRVIAVTQQSDYVLCRDLGTVTLRSLADIVGVKSQMPGVSDYLQTFEWFPEVAARLLSIDQHVEVQFDVPLANIFHAACPAADEYPDEGEGLEMLHSELAGYQTLAGGPDTSEASAVFAGHAAESQSTSSGESHPQKDTAVELDPAEPVKDSESITEPSSTEALSPETSSAEVDPDEASQDQNPQDSRNSRAS